MDGWILQWRSCKAVLNKNLRKDMFPILSQSLCFSGGACPNLGKKPISSQFQILLLRDDVSLSSLCTSGKMRGEKNKRLDRYESNTEQCVGENCRVSDLTRK